MGIQKALLCLSTILISLLSSTTTITAAKDDSVAMAKLAATLHPTPSGWSINSPYCNWPGVTCESQFNRVISIHLDAMFLSSNLPSELSSLTQLQVLSLSNNSLFGSIPSGLSSLAQLLVLDLSNNSLSGSLPALANLTLLQELYLDHNNFTTIPPGFFQGLSGLAYFSISNNIYLEPWTIPTELNQLTNLTLFEANNANVMGSLPDIFYAFPDLTFLILSNNNLTGSLPASFEKTVIQILLLDHQEIGLTGTIDVLSQMTLLNRVLLDNNQFTGPIPDLSNCTYLFELQLSENLLTGLVPTSLISLLSLLNISLANNMLQGPSPVFQKNVQIAVYDNNNFCTNYGDACDPQVTILLEIAAALDYPLRLSEYWKGNDACKDWPFITCNSLGSIMMINLTKQHFGGTISPAFADLTELQILILNENNLTGSIPDSLTKSPHLQILDVSNNNLSGEIPHFASSVKLNANGNAILYTIGIPNGDGPPAANIKVSKEKKISIVLIITAVIIGTITIATCTFFSWSLFAKHKARKEKSKTIRNEKGEVILLINGGEASTKFSGHNVIGGNKNPIRHQELALLNYEKLSTATNNFHLENKLGEGGFGPVYKGKLQDGKEIAVKRLSRTSGQGVEEFINEVMVLSKLQHRNLVRLLGCCVEGKEKMLVYEYMPNKSLDAFIFDPHKEEILDWRKRLKIIEGIARGILYLHRDSRLKIIHRDLKPSNILLDKELSPKISDFGMARIFGGTEDQANTKRVVGTYGYMSPEYAMEGLFSEKSDVFSFGVLLLEIVGGRRNTSFSNNEHALSLLGYAWKQWNEGNIVAIIDPLLSDPCFQMEILKCIQVGLLCVQKSPKDRPTISNVILMLDSEIKYLPTPKQPAFTDTQFAKVTGSCQQRHQRFSINNVTITTIEGR